MRYIVRAGYVTVTTAVGVGRAAIDIPRGECVPGDVPAEEIRQLLARGHIEALPEAETTPSAEPARRPRKRATKTAG